MKSIYFIVLFLFIHPVLYAQFEINGTVVSDSIKLDGVNIYVLNSNKGTITNSKGEFRIHNINPTDTIRFSIIGYQSKDTLFTKDIADVNINLKKSIIELSEIEIIPANYAVNIIKKVNDNLINNYPTNPTAFNAIFRKQIVQNGNYLFLGNAQVSILCPPYI
ncbi:carboxypeptidase-like regulatory domain-containing protein [Flavicella sp.]|uniref:carboxypeptidase-like regulatory domain-containing protein n=1 Tax=Flavicella sp. TaxID=2957742 RepID=UPI00301738B8